MKMKEEHLLLDKEDALSVLLNAQNQKSKL